MKIQGLTSTEVDELVDAFSVLMQQEMRNACHMAANESKFNVTPSLAASGDLFSSMDAITTIVTQWGKAVAAVLVPFLEKTFQKAAKAVATPLGDVTPVKTVNFVASMENKVGSFSNELWQAAKDSLIAGAQDGESVTQLAARIESVASVKKKKAKVIAQTSIIAAVNGGEWQQMMEAASGFDLAMTKEWVATHDEHTRPTHLAADGQVVPLGEKFQVGGSLLDFPGDPYGDPSEIISCRCTTAYDVDLDEPITASQTSLVSLVDGTVVSTDGPVSPELIALMTGASLTAAFDANVHPRGKDGKFIKKGVGLPDGVFDMLNDLRGGVKFANMPTTSKHDFVSELKKLTPEQWDNLKDEDQYHIETALNDAIDEDISGSSAAQIHLNDLDGAGVDLPSEHAAVAEDVPPIDTPNASDTLDAPTLTVGTSEPIKITHGLIHAKHTPGTTIAQGSDGSTIKWNGNEYELTDGETGTTQTVKKSKLYAKLNTGHYSSVTWHKSGKQETKVTHEKPLDAAPPPEPVPHPISVETMKTYEEPTEFTSASDMVKTFKSDKTPNKVFAEGTTPTFPTAQYAYASDETGVKKFMYKTPNHPWKEMGTGAEKNADKIHITWTLTTADVPSNIASSPFADQPTQLKKSEAFGDITGLDLGQLKELDAIYHLYDKGLITTDELKQQVALTKSSGPDVPDVLTVDVTPASSPLASAVKASDIEIAKKWQFYEKFKEEKVSPAWSGAKIYKSIHAAKQKMSGDPEIAGLSDLEMLKIVDTMHSLKQGGAYETPYTNKVNEWLKTPNGVKTFKELNPNIATPPAYVSTPSTPTKSVPKGLGAKYAKKASKGLPQLKKKTGPYVNTPPPASLPKPTKKAAAAKNASVQVDADVSGFSADKKASVYLSFKASTYGKYYNEDPAPLYWNAKTIADLTPGASTMQILAIIDEEGAKKFGVENGKLFETKVAKWLNSPSGKKKAAEIDSGSWHPSASTPAYSSPGHSLYGSPPSKTYDFPVNTPLDEKVKPLQNVEAYDPKKKYVPAKKNLGPPDNDFPVLSGKQASTSLHEWQQKQGTMTPKQKASLKYYTSNSGYAKMNNYLRGYSGASATTHNHVQQAQAGMTLSEQPMVLHRGNGWFTGWQSVEDAKAKVGTQFHQEAFFSTSTGGKSAFSGPINFVIECPPGTPMAYVRDFSHYATEDEMLLGANLTYEVVAVHTSDIDKSWHWDTKVTVVLRVIPPTPNAISYGQAS